MAFPEQYRPNGANYLLLPYYATVGVKHILNSHKFIEIADAIPERIITLNVNHLYILSALNELAEPFGIIRHKYGINRVCG